MEVIEFVTVRLGKIWVANCFFVQYVWDEIKFEIQHLDLFYQVAMGSSYQIRNYCSRR